MAMVAEPSTQTRGIAEIAHDVRMVVKHTFLELVEDEECDVRSLLGARRRSSSEPRSFGCHTVQFNKCDIEQDSTASTQANDTDDDSELQLSDDDESTAPAQAPPGVWAQPMAATQTFVPVCVAFVPVIQQPVWKKSSRSARRRRARAMNRWYRYNTQSGADGEPNEDDVDGEFDDESDDLVESGN